VAAVWTTFAEFWSLEKIRVFLIKMLKTQERKFRNLFTLAWYGVVFSPIQAEMP
jgi:hypothetical protein